MERTAPRETQETQRLRAVAVSVASDPTSRLLTVAGGLSHQRRLPWVSPHLQPCLDLGLELPCARAAGDGL